MYKLHPEDILTSNERVREAVAAAPSGDFGALESLAVWLGMKDGVASLRRQGRLGAWIRDLLGLGPKRPLSDPRLESLRRLTVSLRFDLISRAWEEAAARRAGVTEAQIQALKGRYSEQARAGT